MTDPLGAFLRYLEVEKHASRHTLRSYRTDLQQFLNVLGETERQGSLRERLAAVDARAVRAYLARLHGRGLEPVSVARKLAALRSWLRFCVRRACSNGTRPPKSAAPGWGASSSPSCPLMRPRTS